MNVKRNSLFSLHQATSPCSAEGQLSTGTGLSLEKQLQVFDGFTPGLSLLWHKGCTHRVAKPDRAQELITEPQGSYPTSGKAREQGWR